MLFITRLPRAFPFKYTSGDVARVHPPTAGGVRRVVSCVCAGKSESAERSVFGERDINYLRTPPPLSVSPSVAVFLPLCRCVEHMPLCRVLWFVLNKLLSQNTRNNALSRVAHRQQYIFANTLLLYYPLTLHNTNYKPLYLLRHTRNYTRRALL